MVTNIKAFAKPYFDNNPQLLKLYITEDGHAFIEEIHAVRYCKQNSNIKMHEVKRSNVMAPENPIKKEEVKAEEAKTKIKEEVKEEVKIEKEIAKAKPKQAKK